MSELKRGVVVNPHVGMALVDGGGFYSEYNLSKQEMMYLLLYFDKIAVARPNLLYEVPVCDESELETLGYLLRPEVKVGRSPQKGQSNRISGTEMVYKQLRGQALALRHLSKTDNEHQWGIHQFGGNVQLPDIYLKNQESIRVEITNCLPSPAIDTPYEVILDFKTRRSDELSELQKEVDNFYYRVINASDSESELTSVINEMNKLIDNLQQVANERFIHTVRRNFSSVLSTSKPAFVDGAKDGLIGSALIETGNYILTGGASIASLPIGAAVSGIVSCFKARKEIKLLDPSKLGGSSLSYVSRGFKEKLY